MVIFYPRLFYIFLYLTSYEKRIIYSCNYINSGTITGVLVYREFNTSFINPSWGQGSTLWIKSDADLDAFCSGNGTDGLSDITSHIIHDTVFVTNSSSDVYRYSCGEGCTMGVPYSAITFENITRYLKLVNCTFIEIGVNVLGGSLLLYNNTHTSVISCTFENTGMRTMYGSDVIIANSTFFIDTLNSDNQPTSALFTQYTTDLLIENNSFSLHFPTNLTFGQYHYIVSGGNNVYGSMIWVWQCWNAMIRYNTLADYDLRVDCKNYGYYVGDIPTTVSNNSIIRGEFQLPEARYLWDYPLLVFANNTVNYKPAYLFYNVDLTGFDFSNAGQVILRNCSNILIENAIFKFSSPILMERCNNITIKSCDILHPVEYGIVLRSCNNTVITDNYVASLPYLNDVQSAYRWVSIGITVEGYASFASVNNHVYNLSVTMNRIIGHELGMVIQSADGNEPLNTHLVMHNGSIVYNYFSNNSYNGYSNAEFEAGVDPMLNTVVWSNETMGNYWDDVSDPRAVPNGFDVNSLKVPVSITQNPYISTTSPLSAASDYHVNGLIDEHPLSSVGYDVSPAYDNMLQWDVATDEDNPMDIITWVLIFVGIAAIAIVTVILLRKRSLKKYCLTEAGKLDPKCKTIRT